MPGLSDISAGKAALGGAATTAAADAAFGLERAWSAAGDTLAGVFGGRPWEMTWQEIVSAVGGQAPDAAGFLLGGVL